MADVLIPTARPEMPAKRGPGAPRKPGPAPGEELTPVQKRRIKQREAMRLKYEADPAGCYQRTYARFKARQAKLKEAMALVEQFRAAVASI